MSDNCPGWTKNTGSGCRKAYISFSDSPVHRQGTFSYKWDIPVCSDIIPLSVADMDYYVSEEIQAALSEFIQHGFFGYPIVPDEYFSAFINWIRRRHGFQVQREWLLPASGVIPAITAVINSVAEKGDEVIIQEPVYPRFRECIENAGCRTILNVLINKNGQYQINFRDLEKKAARPNCKILILCNPHNPVGRVWTYSELSKIGSICYKHSVTIISDESHCDITFGRNSHIPFSRINNNQRCRTVVCYSPGKAFNISGLRQATIVIRDQALRESTAESLVKLHANDITMLAAAAQIAAYTHSETWLDEALHYICNNILLLQRFMRRYYPDCTIYLPEGTYLVWIDVSRTRYSGDHLSEILESEARIRVNKGADYGISGRHCIRINLACHRVVLEEALRRLKYLSGADRSETDTDAGGHSSGKCCFRATLP